MPRSFRCQFCQQPKHYHFAGADWDWPHLTKRLRQVWQALFSWCSFCGADSRSSFTRTPKLSMPQLGGTTDENSILRYQTCQSNCKVVHELWTLDEHWASFFFLSFYYSLLRYRSCWPPRPPRPPRPQRPPRQPPPPPPPRRRLRPQPRAWPPPPPRDHQDNHHD